MGDSVLARVGNDIEVVEDPLAGEVGGREYRVEVDEADDVALVLGKEQHRFVFAEAGEKKTARSLLIRRPSCRTGDRRRKAGQGRQRRPGWPGESRYSGLASTFRQGNTAEARRQPFLFWVEEKHLQMGPASCNCVQTNFPGRTTAGNAKWFMIRASKHVWVSRIRARGAIPHLGSLYQFDRLAPAAGPRGS